MQLRLYIKIHHCRSLRWRRKIIPSRIIGAGKRLLRQGPYGLPKKALGPIWAICLRRYFPSRDVRSCWTSFHISHVETKNAVMNWLKGTERILWLYRTNTSVLEVPEHPLLVQFFFRVHDFFHYRFISFQDLWHKFHQFLLNLKQVLWLRIKYCALNAIYICIYIYIYSEKIWVGIQRQVNKSK